MRFAFAVFVTALAQWLLRDQFIPPMAIAFLMAITLAFTMDVVQLMNMLHNRSNK